MISVWRLVEANVRIPAECQCPLLAQVCPLRHQVSVSVRAQRPSSNGAAYVSSGSAANGVTVSVARLADQ